MIRRTVNWCSPIIGQICFYSFLILFVVVNAGCSFLVMDMVRITNYDQKEYDVVIRGNVTNLPEFKLEPLAEFKLEPESIVTTDYFHAYPWVIEYSFGSGEKQVLDLKEFLYKRPNDSFGPKPKGGVLIPHSRREFNLIMLDSQLIPVMEPSKGVKEKKISIGEKVKQ